MGKAMKVANKAGTKLRSAWREAGVLGGWLFLGVLMSGLLQLPMHVTCLSLMAAVTFLPTVAAFLGPGERQAVDQSQVSYKRAFFL